jgi:hypothetical protein
MATATLSAQPQAAGRGSCRGSWRLVVAAYAARIQGSGPYAPVESERRGAQYRTACWRVILLPVATRLSPHTARL